MRPTIGLLGCYLSGSYEGALVGAACRATTRHGGRFIAVRSLGLLGDDSLSASLDDLGELAWAYVDGWLAQCSAASASYLNALQDRGKPVVMIGNDDPGIDCPKVVSDNACGIYEAVDHLVQHGHRRIGFVGWLRHFDICERLGAYQDALRRNGIEPDPELVFPAENNFEHGAVPCAHEMIRRGLPCTAVIAGTDLNAVGVIGALASAGYSVPSDMAVVGFDDKPDAALLSPSLTTVSQGPARLGETGLELLMRLLEGEHVATGRHLVPTSLVVRESCGCAKPKVRGDGAEVSDGLITSDYYRLRQSLRSGMHLALALLRSKAPSSLDWLSLTGAHEGLLALEDGADGEAAGAKAFDRLRTLTERVVPGAAQGEARSVALAGRDFPPAELVDSVPPGQAVCLFPFRGSMGPRGVLVTVQELGPEIEDEGYFMWAHIFNELMEHRAVLSDLQTKTEELAGAYGLLRERALHDDLTGLANRRHFREQLTEAMALSAGDSSCAYAVLWMDVDNFKVLNDTLGHAAGDSVLVEAADRLRRNIRNADVAARIGGDEFVVLVDASSEHGLDALVERLATALNQPYEVDGKLLPVTVSIGLALGGPQHVGPDDILREADLAMYRAKLTHSGAVVRSGG
ncbi:MAG TPA: GGDEF domain-containing protein [Acidimicrobiales bacterium]|nr:GGDEF domain-containing protein [Acidimicrobiales bacterium]